MGAQFFADVLEFDKGEAIDGAGIDVDGAESAGKIQRFLFVDRLVRCSYAPFGGWVCVPIPFPQARAWGYHLLPASRALRGGNALSGTHYTGV